MVEKAKAALSGKKTTLVSVVIMANSLLAVLNGDMNLGEWLQSPYFQDFLTGGGLHFLRLGIKKGA